MVQSPVMCSWFEVPDFLKKVVNDVKDLAKTTENALEKLVDDAKDGAEKLIDAVKFNLKLRAKVIEKGVERLGDGLNKAFKDVPLLPDDRLT